MNADYHGKEYLLQCASTYNWDVLIHRCSELSQIFSSSSSSPRLVEEGILQLSTQDQYGNNCLHAACYNTPPARVVASILNCASLVKLQLNKVVTRDGSTPLGIACATGASIDVLRLLLDPPPLSTKSLGPVGSHHLDCCHPEGASLVTLPDSRGCTPLSELASHYELQQKAPWNSRTATPLDQVTNTTTTATTGNHDHGMNHEGNDDVDPLFHSFWAKVELLLKAAWFHANHKNNFNSPGSWISILHGAAHVADTCPGVLTSLIVRCHPTTVSVMDHRHGLLPLHLAVISGRDRLDAAESIQKSYNHSLRRTVFIKTLLDCHPASASVKFVNGRSVLCEAISSGLHWHVAFCDNQAAGAIIYTAEGATASVDQDSTTGPLQYIWKSHPEAMCQKDSQTGLYPFMLAASMTSNHSSKREMEHDIEQLDTIYGMLRVHPQLLSQVLA
mmetsp:Transcript_22331/g.41592  ORF Transcript_22331/g.41592 Transcript_22331/m.41592 type:complete len:446 (+) Transcript_22331:76-1413(+)